GLVCAPVNLGLRPSEIAWCLRDAAARVLIVEAPLADMAKGVLAEDLPRLAHRFHTGPEFDQLLASGRRAPLEVEVHDRDVVQLLYTSG
ncbi:AMP-binding protein, partial [Variovorax sp. 2RAF20]